MERFPTSLPISKVSTQLNDFSACELCAQTCHTQQMQTAGLLSELLMLRTSPPVQLQIDGLCGSRAWAGRTDLKSVERPFLLIRLNHWRQMQPIQNSGNLWILRWALTYITMTSKHNFRGHIFRLFLLPLLFLSLLCPRLTRYCCCC